jgi:superfamily II RNA helicase
MFREYPATKILAELDRDDLLPAILFRTSRRQCDDDVIRLSESRVGKIPESQQDSIRDAVEAVCTKYGIEREILVEHPHYSALVETASGAHHAGQLLAWRLLLEELMSRNTLRLMVATGTVAAGVDFPARTVVVTAHSRRGAEGFQTLTASEFQQMSGRAGRRGKDSVGICLIAPGHFSDARVFHEVIDKPPEPLRSAYFAAPATVLNLLKYRSVDDLRYTVARSLASFHDKKEAVLLREQAEQIESEVAASEEPSSAAVKKLVKRARRKVRDAEQLEAKQETLLNLSLDGLRELGHLEGHGLSGKGYWAAQLCTNLVLHLAEAIDDGIFYDLREEELVALVASISGDSHRVYYSLARNPIERELYDQMRDVVERVAEKYKGPGTTEYTSVLPDAALTVLAWMDSEDWMSFAGLLRLAGVAAGDAARIISQTADHLHQISRLEETHPPLAETALRARARLLRPPLSDSLIIDDSASRVGIER